MLKDVDQNPRTLVIFNLVYGTDEIRKRTSLNFDTIAHFNIIQTFKDTMLIAPFLKALDDRDVDGSINAVERYGLGYASSPVDALPWDGVDCSAYKKISWEQRSFGI